MLHALRTLIVLLSLSLIACGETSTPSSLGESPLTQEPEGTIKNDYSEAATWLCRPERNDHCTVDLTTSVVAKDGTVTTEPFTPAQNPEIDCFYVYPTVSRDTTPNADMNAGPGEISVVAAQFARYSSVCRTFAPLYRQVSLTALRARRAGQPINADRELAFNDVVDAWNHYLEHDNQGRGVVLVGHSQGSGVLTRLIAEKIEGTDTASLMIAAHLIGTRLAIPQGDVVGGSFKTTPLCTDGDQTGCVVTFASFRDTVPPPANTLFGKVPGENMVAACNNPGELDGSNGALNAYLSAAGPGVSSGAQAAWSKTQEVTNPYVSVPGLLSAQCVNDERGSWLEVTVHGDPMDARTDDISGDVTVDGVIQADWGLHLIDVHLAMGNLVRLAERQGAAWLASH